MITLKCSNKAMSDIVLPHSLKRIQNISRQTEAKETKRKLWLDKHAVAPWEIS